MMNSRKLAGFLVAAVVLAGGCSSAQKAEGPALSEQVTDTVALMVSRDPNLQLWFDDAYGYAVYPSVTKGAFVVGGAHGTGQVFEQGKLIGTTSLTQGTIGAQIGGQAYSELVFFKDKWALDTFKRGDLELAAQASAVAVGAGASSDADYESGVAVFTMAKGGLMLEASVGGQKFDYTPME
jgi:lipid-binding SYLF domain-containing protein